jgi:hypothetical protein
MPTFSDQVDASGRPYDIAPARVVSTFDSEMMARLEQHLEDERASLVEYEKLAETSPDEPIRYLAGLLLEDERRHHRVLLEMLNWFRSSATLEVREPHVPWLTRSHDPTLAATVRRLRKQERHDLRELKTLRRRLSFLRRDSLLGVLVRSLELDTRKHMVYLETMQRIADRAARS